MHKTAMAPKSTVLSWCEANNCIIGLNHGLETILRIAKMEKGLLYQRPDYTNTLKKIPVRKNDRLKVVAGKVSYRKWYIDLHPALYDKEDHVYADRFDTFFHELSHLAAFAYFREHGHGQMWQMCMLAFGFIPSNCYDPHKFDYRNHEIRQAERLLEGMGFDL